MAKRTIDIKVKVKYVFKYIGKRFSLIVVRIIIGHNYKTYKIIYGKV